MLSRGIPRGNLLAIRSLDDYLRGRKLTKLDMLIMASRATSAVIMVSILVLSIPEVVPQSNQNLTFMFITSFGRFGLNSSGAIPAAEIALDAINADPNLLPDYNLVYDRVRDSEVSISNNQHAMNPTYMQKSTCGLGIFHHPELHAGSYYYGCKMYLVRKFCIHNQDVFFKLM